MKKVIINDGNKDVVLHDQITVDEFYYGVRSHGFKGFIVKREDFKFSLINFGLCEEHMGSSEYIHVSELIKRLLLKGFEVFEFDTNKELLLWLA